ncbi:MAG: efflux RND transporter periplasmic adaptor subunit [Catenulispora sp.]
MTDSPRLPKGVWINTSLAVVVAAGGAGAWVLLGDSSPSTAATSRTVAVQRGDVTAQVSASGNVTLPTEDDLAFTASGPVTEVDVKVGDQVKAGQVLAKIDPAQANQQLTAAQAQLATAQAQLAKLQQGQTPQQAALSAQQLKSAADSLAAARTAYADAQNSISVDTSNLQAAVNTAKDTLSADQATQAADCAAPAKTTCPADGNKVAQDQNALTQAQNAQKTGSQKDTQSLHQAQNSLTQAQNSYNTAVDQQAVSAAPATPDQLAQANQAIVTAQNAVATAQKAVAGTTITAPQAGTVLSVGGTVGDVVSAGAASSSSAASSSASGSSGTSGSGSGGAAASSASGSSKFIVLGDMTALTVRAEFAETDAAKLKAGEAAQVTINAVPGSALTATVQSVDPTATVVSNVVEYGVTLQFTTGQQELAALKPGQTASVSVVTDKVTNVLYVPSSSVTKVGGQSLVTVVAGGTQTPTPVQVGVVGDTATEITSGLNEGDLVLLSSRTGTTTGGTRGGFGGAGGAGGAGGLGGLTGGKPVVGP